jgi:mannobiose 2-epimerase
MTIHAGKNLITFLVLPMLLRPNVSERETGTAAVRTETTTDRSTIAAEIRQVLDEEIARWYPLCIDTGCGGYYSDVNARWELEGPQDKMIVTQARHVWSASHAAMFYQKDNSLRTAAFHGVEFLRDRMWDHEFGGFYTLVNRRGHPIPEGGRIVKRAYGNAFAIYGLTTYYETSGDTSVLKLAQEAFAWLEKHSYDPAYGGYYQFIARDGTPHVDGFNGTPPKDQNSSIHLLECFTALYRVWPDTLLRNRLLSLLQILRDTITTDRGYMRLFFERDWTPVSYRDSTPAVREQHFDLDHVSFGHDIETAYLLLEASEALGMPNDAATLRVAKAMVDHTVRNGWDGDAGGIYDRGYYFRGEERPSIIRKTKEWWTQAEALNSLLLMSELYPDDGLQYYARFCAQWEYCKNSVIDPERGGWYWGGADMVPENRYSAKGSIWKADYHTSRALINCLRRLKRESVAREYPRHDPVNTAITPGARQLLEYLYSISGRKIVAGHHNYVGRPDFFVHRVRELTGKTPAIWGCDFIHYYSPGVGERIVQEAAKKHGEGYIITLMWHAGRPQDDPPFGWKESIQAKLTDSQWVELLTPGSGLHKRWLDQVDAVAYDLKELQKRGVPVLWRPYHELNGVWFWWGNRKGTGGSAGLYRMMYDRYVNYHKLNNLIWVWNTNAPRQLIDDEAYAYEDFYPGTEFVDVLAADVYHNDYRQSHHDELVELGQGKVIALGEVGEVPTPGILSRQSRWSWFMIWGDFVDSHNTPERIRDLYTYPGIVTHETIMAGD